MKTRDGAKGRRPKLRLHNHIAKWLESGGVFLGLADRQASLLSWGLPKEKAGSSYELGCALGILRNS